MPVLTLTEFELHSEGAHDAVIGSIEDAPPDKSTYGPAIVIQFITDEGLIDCIASLKYSSKSKLAQLTNAVYGRMPDALNTDDLKGKRVGVVVQHFEKDGMVRHKVESFFRVKTKAAISKPTEPDPFADAP